MTSDNDVVAFDQKGNASIVSDNRAMNAVDQTDANTIAMANASALAAETLGAEAQTTGTTDTFAQNSETLAGTASNESEAAYLRDSLSTAASLAEFDEIPPLTVSSESMVTIADSEVPLADMNLITEITTSQPMWSWLPVLGGIFGAVDGLRKDKKKKGKGRKDEK